MQEKISTSPDIARAKKKLLFLFPHPVKSYIQEIRQGVIPSERLYGVIELLDKGWDVEICDSRFEGLSGWLLNIIRRYEFNLIDFTTAAEFAKSDIIIMKDNFSLLATIVAKILGKKIVYVDSMFRIPRRWWKRWLTRLNLKLADAIVAYSDSQVKLWAKEFNMPESRFKVMRYTIDLNFYQPHKAKVSEKPFVMAVGRDTGRDFHALAEALDGTGIGLKLVTLPYLIKGLPGKYPWVEVCERLSYNDLFDLYAQALLVAVPLKPDISYPSGIRGALEAMALGKATICTRTSVLEEVLEDRKDLIFVEAGNPGKIRAEIKVLLSDQSRRTMLEQNASRAVREKFGMLAFVEPLERLLHSL